MPETEHTPEQLLTIDKITQGDCVVYATEIRQKSMLLATQDEDQQLRALTEISKKAAQSREKIIGTALLSTSTQEDWPVTRLRSTLIVIGSSPVTHPREPLGKDAKRDYQIRMSQDTMLGTAMLAPEWQNLFKGGLSKDVLRPVAVFADDAIQKLGRNINVSVSLPNLGAWTAYMMATKRAEPLPLSVPQLAKTP